MIRDMSIQWLKPGDSCPDEDGLIIAIKESSLFSGTPDVLIVESRKRRHPEVQEKTDSTYTEIFVRYDISEKFCWSKPSCKLVGDPERGTSRRVYEYIGKDSGLDFRLGLTVHEAQGTWSSEPHDFELESMKTLKPMRFWEQFAYITEPINEWAIQVRRGFMANGSWGMDMVVIRDRDILDIPLGLHMVTAGPGVKLAYIWVYQAEDISKAEKF